MTPQNTLNRRVTLALVGIAAGAVLALALTPPSYSVDYGTDQPAKAVTAHPEAIQTTPVHLSAPQTATQAVSHPAKTITPSAAPRPAESTTVPQSAVSSPDWTYAPCDWFATGHPIPAYTHTDRCYSTTGTLQAVRK